MYILGCLYADGKCSFCKTEQESIVIKFPKDFENYILCKTNAIITEWKNIVAYFECNNNVCTLNFFYFMWGISYS